ncbi:Dolichyl-diphosphooligosaccharide--protein glycosyltransferase subunit wbp1 [Yarrowia sp. C11]|nr:Dolichyl-diphosphooligosaccharide--protein glycosyltransferase subunit wbp1 [Yarrowia sp. E02]KAG5369385.1 Dolichyl-diphosphooligosaccharide--protein glycosyltransferase subunit wbp1 [Yarrowia sp. C11]
MLFVRTLVLAFAGLVAAKPPVEARTAVIVDKNTDLAQYSQFFEDAELLLDAVTVVDVRDKSFDLFTYGYQAYDMVVLFPPQVKSLGPALTSRKLLEFFNKGGHILSFTTPEHTPESIRDFAQEMGISMAPKYHKLVDHFGESGPNHDALTLETVNKVVSGADSVVYSGSAAYLSNNPQLVPLLTAPSTSYVYDYKEDEEDEENAGTMGTPWITGSQGFPAVGFQGKNNARFAWVGGDIMTNEQYAAHPGNRQFIKDVVEWVSVAKNVISPEYIRHHLAATPDVLNEKIYKVNEDITYSVALTEWDNVKEDWVPFIADDVQIEFTMLDPYYRLTLEQTGTTNFSAIYSTTFKIPDQHGVFTFNLDYKRPGYTFIEEKTRATIRHTANDEWPRSWEITNSWVYLTSAVMVVIAWFLFVVFYLFVGKAEKEAVHKQ